MGGRHNVAAQWHCPRPCSSFLRPATCVCVYSPNIAQDRMQEPTLSQPVNCIPTHVSHVALWHDIIQTHRSGRFRVGVWGAMVEWQYSSARPLQGCKVPRALPAPESRAVSQWESQLLCVSLMGAGTPGVAPGWPRALPREGRLACLHALCQNSL